MRIQEEYKRAGYFWLPSNQDTKIPGTLTITDGGDIELDVLGLFDEGNFFNNGEHFARIIGIVEKDGYITLENCFYTKKNYTFCGLSKSLLVVNQVFSGVAYDKDELATFNSLCFSVEGLDEWLGVSGISIVYGQDYRTATIEYSPPEKISYDLDNGFNLDVLFKYTLPSGSSITEAKVTQGAFFRLSSDVSRDVSEFIEILHKITYFLCFAIDATVTIKDVTVASNELTESLSDEKRRPIKIKLYYSSLPFSGGPPRIDRHRMLFRFIDIQDNAEALLKNWLNAYSVIRPALGLYFSATTGSYKYLDGKFLALAQGLETYHRRTSPETMMEAENFNSLVDELICCCPVTHKDWLRGRLIYGNEISLAKRIKSIIAPYQTFLGNKKERKQLIRSIVDTRNYLTHYSDELEDKAYKGKDLWGLCQKMEGIFQLHLLQQLGFSDSKIKDILNQNYKLKQKITYTD